MATKKVNAQSAQSENVNKVVKAIASEGASIGAIIRKFIAVAESNEFASYMLRTICKHENPIISLSVNEIKKRVITCYPYKDENNTLLKKENDLYVPIESYSGDIIRKAFYNAVGATNVQKEFAPATEEQIKEHTKAKEEKKAQKKTENEQKKARTEMYEAFYNELMQCKNMEEAWTIIRTHKANESK